MTELPSPKLYPHIAVRFFRPATAEGRARPRILLLKLDHIGDFLTAIPAFRVLRRAFADAEISLICLPSLVELAQSTGLFDSVKGFAAIPDSAQWQRDTAPPSPAQQIAAFKALLDEPYFLAADFKHDPLNRFGLDHVDAEHRAAFIAKTEKGIDVVLPLMEWKTPVSMVGGGVNLPPHAEVRLTLLAHAIIEMLVERPLEAGLFQVRRDLAAIPSYRALVDSKRMKIGLSVGAGAELRKWHPVYWTQLLQKLTDKHNPHFVFFGSEADQAESRALAALVPPGQATDLTGVLPLVQVPAYMDLLNGYIGCDTGLTHLAGNMGLPTVNIFAGISNISVWRARGPKVKTIYADVTCAPCHKRFKDECPHDTVCMKAILPETVQASFEQMIGI